DAGSRAAALAPAPSAFAAIAPVVDQAIAHGDLPGAVILIGRGDEVIYRHAFGQRAVQPAPEPMTEDTIFDLASLTKVVATTSVMQRGGQGRARLEDPVVQFIPDFGQNGKSGITTRHLMTHTSGLRPALPLETVFNGANEAIRRASQEVPTAPPGEKFI